MPSVETGGEGVTPEASRGDQLRPAIYEVTAAWTEDGEFLDIQSFTSEPLAYLYLQGVDGGERRALPKDLVSNFRELYTVTRYRAADVAGQTELKAQVIDYAGKKDSEPFIIAYEPPPEVGGWDLFSAEYVTATADFCNIDVLTSLACGVDIRLDGAQDNQGMAYPGQSNLFALSGWSALASGPHQILVRGVLEDGTERSVSLTVQKPEPPSIDIDGIWLTPCGNVRFPNITSGEQILFTNAVPGQSYALIRRRVNGFLGGPPYNATMGMQVTIASSALASGLGNVIFTPTFSNYAGMTLSAFAGSGSGNVVLPEELVLFEATAPYRQVWRRKLIYLAFNSASTLTVDFPDLQTVPAGGSPTVWIYDYAGTSVSEGSTLSSAIGFARTESFLGQFNHSIGPTGEPSQDVRMPSAKWFPAPTEPLAAGLRVECARFTPSAANTPYLGHYITVTTNPDGSTTYDARLPNVEWSP